MSTSFPAMLTGERTSGDPTAPQGRPPYHIAELLPAVLARVDARRAAQSAVQEAAARPRRPHWLLACPATRDEGSLTAGGY